MSNKPDLIPVRIKKNVQWRGAWYYEHAYYDLSPEYAKHVVEALGVAEYMTEEMHQQRLDGTDE